VRYSVIGRQDTRLAAIAIACAVMVASAGGAYAETIASALAKAYTSNPQLDADRARQRATDEQVPQAKSGWRPTVTANADIGKTWQGSSLTGDSEFVPGGFQIQLSQPVFEGFRTEHATRQAEASVQAGNQNLLATEQQVLLDGATAYMNVIRDREIVTYRQQASRNFDEQVRAAKARFNVGEVTRTDVAQARASASQAKSDLAVAIGNLQTSVAAYIRVIGNKPGRLKFPGLSRRVPKSLRRAIATAGEINPQILAAAFNEEAAIAAIGVEKSDLLPKLNFEAQYQVSSNPSSTISNSESGTIQGTLSVPLYQSGRQYSEIRQAKQTASQSRLQVLDARRQVRQSVVQAWHLLKTAAATISAAKDAVSANRIALDGVRQEALVGTRTTLDVLDAQTALVNSQIALASSRRDRIVAGYQLVAAIGKMTAADLRLSVNLYNPSRNLDRVRDKAFGSDIGPAE
jgi:TolC family type I secretion outer membrane protein